MHQEDPPDRDMLAKADTQPKMLFFVPFELAVALFIGIAGIGTVYHRFMGFAGLIPGIPIWFLAAILCKRDLNGIKVFMVKTRLFSLYLDAYRWEGTLSLSPWPRKSRQQPYAV